MRHIGAIRIIACFLFCLAVSCGPEPLPDTPAEPDVPVEPVDPSPEPEPEPGPDPGPDVPDFEKASEAVVNMGVGWNLGNTLDTWWSGGSTPGWDTEAWETGWGQYVTTPGLMAMMKEAGFGAIRVPVTWGVHMDASGKVYDQWMNRVQEVVDYVIDAGMYCILNVHHDTGAHEDAWLVASPSGYLQAQERYVALWTQIAERFRDYDHHLLFEAYNEMLDDSRSWCYASMNQGYDAASAASSYIAINNYARTFVNTVRGTGGNNAVRNLVVNTYGACNGAGSWSRYLLDPLMFMDMPSDKVEGHVAFQVHAYPEIDNLPAMEAEVGAMFESLDRHLVSKGGPVIIGEWGTFSENPSEENLLYYASWFVAKAKEYGMGTFHWMGLSDGFARSLPAFSEPELAGAIVDAYHGEGTASDLPSLDDFDITYEVTYGSQWSELNLSSSVLSLDDYAGVKVVLAEAPAEGFLSVKVYGESDGKEQYTGISEALSEVYFDRSILGSKARRVTLQYMKAGSFTVSLDKVILIRKDGSEEEALPSVFWGCTMETSINDRSR